MRIIAFFCILSCLALVSCATHHLQDESNRPISLKNDSNKSPQQITWFVGKKMPHKAYRVIGVALVPSRNALGMKRAIKTQQFIMNKLAASMGGDGLIDVTQQSDNMQAKVIAFQKILI